MSDPTQDNPPPNDVRLSVSPEDFGPNEDLPIGQLLRTFTRKQLVPEQASNPLTSVQLDLLLSMREQFQPKIDVQAFSPSNLNANAARTLSLDIGSRYLPMNVDTDFGNFGYGEVQDIIPDGGWRYQLNASLLKLWIEEEAAQQEWIASQTRARSEARRAQGLTLPKATPSAAASIPAAARASLDAPKRQLRQAMMEAVDGDPSKLSRMLHGSAAEQALKRVQELREKRTRAQEQQKRAASRAQTTMIDLPAVTRPATPAFALNNDALQMLSADIPALNIDASDPKMTFEGAAQTLFKATRQAARRQLLGEGPALAASSQAVARQPGLLAASAEQRAVKNSLKLARLFRPNSEELTAVETAAISRSPFRNLLQTTSPQNLPIGDAPLQMKAPLFASTPQTTQRPLAALGSRSERIAEFGSTALKALQVVDNTPSRSATNAPPAQWMRRGGRGVLLDGLIGGNTQAQPAYQRATNAAVQTKRTASSTLDNVALTAAAIAAQTPTQSATSVAQGTYPATMSSGRNALTMASPDFVVNLARASQQAQRAQRASAMDRSLVATSAQETRALRTLRTSLGEDVGPMARTQDAPKGSFVQARQELAQLLGYDATQSGDFAEILASSTVSNPVLRQRLQALGSTRSKISTLLDKIGVPAPQLAAALRDVDEGSRSITQLDTTNLSALQRSETSSVLDAFANPDTVQMRSLAAPRAMSSIQIEDVALQPGYFNALQTSVEGLQRTAGFVSRFNPTTLNAQSRATNAAQRTQAGRGATLSFDQIASVAQDLGIDLLTGNGKLATESKPSLFGNDASIQQNLRISSAANRIADTIRGNYTPQPKQDAKTRAMAMMRRNTWGPDAVYLQMDAPRPQNQTAARNFTGRAPSQAAIQRVVEQTVQQRMEQLQSGAGTDSITRIAELRELASTIRPQDLSKVQSDIAERVQETVNRQMRLFSPEKTLSMLAPQLQAGGLLDASSRNELAAALRDLAQPTRSASSATKRIQTSFGTLTVRMDNGRLVVDAEEVSSAAKSVQMRSVASAQPAVDNIAALGSTPTRQIASLASLNRPSTVQLQRDTAATPVLGSIAALSESVARNLAERASIDAPTQTRSAAQNIELTLGRLSRAERNAGVSLNPAQLKNILLETVNANVPRTAQAQDAIRRLGLDGNTPEQPLAVFPSARPDSSINVFARSDKSAALVAALSKTPIALPSRAMETLIQASQAGSSEEQLVQMISTLATPKGNTPAGSTFVEASRLGNAIQQLAQQRSLLTSTSDRIASLGDDGSWTPTAGQSTASLAALIADNAEQGSTGALGMLGMASPSNFNGLSKADLAYAMPFLQRSAPVQNAGRSRSSVARSAQTAAPSPEAILSSPRLVQELLQKPEGRQAIDRALGTVSSVSGSALLELGLSLGTGGDLLQTARRLNLSNTVLKTLEVIENTPSLKSQLSTSSLASPSGFARTVGMLPSILETAQETLREQTSQVGQPSPLLQKILGDNAPSSLSGLSTTVANIVQRAQNGASLTTQETETLVASLTGNTPEKQRARARAMAMFPAMERVMASVGQSGFQSAGQSATRLQPKALSGSLLRRFESVDRVLSDLGFSSGMTSPGEPSRTFSTRGIQLPRALVTPDVVIQRLQSKGASTSQISAIAGMLSEVKGSSASGLAMELTRALEADPATFSADRLGQVGVWFPAAIERLTGEDTNDMLESSGDFGAQFLLPSMFSAQNRSKTFVSPTSNQMQDSTALEIRSEMLKKRAHTMALGLQTMFQRQRAARTMSRNTTISDLTQVGVGGTARVGTADWMSSTASQNGIDQILTMLGMEGVSSPEDVVSPVMEALGLPGGVNINLDGGSSSKAASSSRVDLSKTLLSRTRSRSSNVADGASYQGGTLSTQRTFFSPFQAPDAAGMGANESFAPRAAMDGASGGSAASAAAPPEDTNVTHKLDEHMLEDTAREIFDEIIRRWSMELERRGM